MAMTGRMLAVGLLLGVAATGSAQQAGKAANKDKVICKRLEVTGSLVSVKKECRTRAEWDRIAQRNRAAGERLVESNRPGFGVGK